MLHANQNNHPIWRSSQKQMAAVKSGVMIEEKLRRIGSSDVTPRRRPWQEQFAPHVHRKKKVLKARSGGDVSRLERCGSSTNGAGRWTQRRAFAVKGRKRSGGAKRISSTR
jgi:hypothetical protein